MTATTTVEHTIDINASPETVYELWTTADGLAAWFGNTARADHRIGGEIHVDVDGEHVMSGEFVELDPPGRIVFTFGWIGGDLPPGSTTVEVTIESVERGARLRLRHSELPVEVAESHDSGWTHFLGELAVAGSQA